MLLIALAISVSVVATFCIIINNNIIHKGKLTLTQGYLDDSKRDPSHPP